MKELEKYTMDNNKIMEDSLDYEKTIKKDGMTKRICINKCENGYIISISCYGEKDGKYMDECKKYISKVNPLKKEDSDVISLKEFLSE